MSTNQFLANSPLEKWLITLTVMLVAVMDVLDITIVTVALREMMGAFGATSSQIAWVVTAYVVASAVVMPLTGFLVGNYGRRKVLLVTIIGFMITSVLCGLSTNLLEIIIFRALQGVFAASLIPLSQLILRETFPQQQLDKAMAVWAMGIMVGPIIGPALGGYITQHLSWHWIFFMNVPVCVIAFILSMSLIKESPISKQPIDWFGLALLATGVGSLQTFIEEGYRYNWFASHTLLFLCLLAVFSIAAFLIHGIGNPYCIVKMSIFLDRQFTSCTLMITVYSMALFGVVILQALMIEVLIGDPPLQTGLIMVPRGLAALVTMPLIPTLLKLFNAKLIIVLGLIISAFGTFVMTSWNLQTNMGTLAWESGIQGIGMSFVLATLSIIVFDTLTETDTAAASGMFSFGRSIGLSVGVALLTTILTDETQINWHRLGGYLNTFNANFIHWLNIQNLSLHDPIVPEKLANILYTQSSMIAFLNVYWIAAIAFLLMIPLVLLIPHGRVNSKMIGAH